MLLLSVRVPPDDRITEPALRAALAVKVVPAVIEAEPETVTTALSVTEPLAEKPSEPAETVPLVVRLPVSLTVKAPPTVDDVKVAKAVSEQHKFPVLNEATDQDL